QMVTDKADSADPLHQHRRLPEWVALNELLEAAELDDMQPGVDDVVVVVEVHGDLAVALDPGDGIDDQLSAHGRLQHSVVVIQRPGQRNGTTVDQIVEHREDGVRVRWTTGDEVVHLDHFVAWVDLGGDPGDIRVGRDDGHDTRNRRGRVDVRLRQTVLQLEDIAHRRDAAPDGAGSDGDQDVAVVPEMSQRFDVVLIRNTPLDEADRTSF